jgi:hypothetical protein
MCVNPVHKTKQAHDRSLFLLFGYNWSGGLPTRPTISKSQLFDILFLAPSAIPAERALSDGAS